MTADTIQPRDVEFLWPGYLVRGSINNLMGDGGAGKGYISADLASRISRGTEFPDGSENILGPADVLFLESEDTGRALSRRLEKQRAEQLAKKAHVGRPYLARLETARQDPTLRTLEKLAKALGVKVTKLIE